MATRGHIIDKMTCHQYPSPIFMKSYDHLLFRACYVLGLNSHPIPYRDRSAIARCDRDDLIPNGDWSVLANNLNQAFLNLSIFSDF